MMNRISVIGAGTMGIGVAHCLAQAGYSVTVVDISDEILLKAKKAISFNVSMQAFSGKKGPKVSPDEVLNHITFITDIKLVSDSELIIENVTENSELKTSIYKQLNELCSNECIYLVNTSCISITKIAACMSQPDHVIGAHFMNPVPYIDAVEVIRGFYSSDEILENVKDFLKTLGKKAIIVNDYPGFVSNRISHLMMNEAAFILQDGVATVKDIDSIFKECYGHKMGPLETADLIGLDTVVDSLDELYKSYQDSKFRCCPLLKKMVDAGQLGCKTKKGFYTY